MATRPDASPTDWGVVAVGASGSVTGGGGTSTLASTYQGTYNSATNYALSDIVVFSGSSYIFAYGRQSRQYSSGKWFNLLGPVSVRWPGHRPRKARRDQPGATGAQGSPGLGFAGAYNSITNYNLDDVVSFQGFELHFTYGKQPRQHTRQVVAAWGLLAAAGVGTTGAVGATGAIGPQGPAGPIGITGAIGPQGVSGLVGARGLPGLVYQGAYASATNYALGDVVLWQGASWASLVDGNHGNTPNFSPAYWGVLTLQGPSGLVGATGGAGPTGATGALGPVGPPGERGDQGLQGIAGQAGAQGIPGVRGDTGLSGPAGPQGIAGPVGLAFQGTYQSASNYALADGVVYNGSSYVSLSAGNHGNTPDQSPAAWALFAAGGAAGAVGAIGPAGLSGPSGPQGVQGSAGPVGPAGAIGPHGPPVVQYLGNYASANNYAVADAVAYAGSTYVSLVGGNHGNTPDVSPAQWSVLVARGADGAAGPAGAQGLAGAAGPAGAAGQQGLQGPPASFTGGWSTSRSYALGDAVSYNGGSYIALTVNTGREPDISPVYWAVLAQAGGVGPAGAQGAQGLEGPTGYPGPVGATGPAGSQGPAGAAGAIGPAGATGPAGGAGPQGPTGIAGLAYRGTYNSTTNYGLNDGVFFNGSTYISLLASNSGNTPDASPSSWALLAAQGAAGAPGAAGQSGANGAAGPQGATGPPGARRKQWGARREWQPGACLPGHLRFHP